MTFNGARSVARKSAALIFAAGILANCITVADRVPVQDDLVTDALLGGRENRPVIALEIQKPNTMKVVLQFEDSDNYQAIYDYDPNIVEITRNILTDYFTLHDRKSNHPKFSLVLEGISADGNCVTPWGGFSDCTQYVTFRGTLYVTDQYGRITDHGVSGDGRAFDEDFVWLPDSFDPLHREAVKSAYAEFIEDVILAIDTELADIGDAES